MSTKKKTSVTKSKTPLTDEVLQSKVKLEVSAALDQATNTDGLIMVNNLDDFVTMITAWHTANADMLRKMATIPGDGGMTVEYNGQPEVMEGKFHSGFVMGITTALGMFGSLPFQERVVEDQPADTKPDEPATASD